MTMVMKAGIFITVMSATLCMACSEPDVKLENALKWSGANRQELEYVLEHYRSVDADSQKLEAARFLIENMPAHYSYSGDDILRYYDVALRILSSDLPPVAQRDTLLEISRRDFPAIEENTVSDIKIITHDFLISSIDNAFMWWRQSPWSAHVTFSQFKEWILPYKTVEYQQLDGWRDTLQSFFSGKLLSIQPSDEGAGTAFRALDLVRNDILDKIHPVGVYTGTGYPMLSASTLPRQTYGSCANYVCLGVSAYRSMGIPAIIDYTPCWGRFRSGHTWYTLLSDQGKELASEWDISSVPGSGFFQYERIPKVYRNTYAVNPERLEYRKKSKFRYPFNLCETDVTDRYMETADIDVQLFRANRDGKRLKFRDRYCYIAVFNGFGTEWQIVDYGTIRKYKAHFHNMGRNILYMVLGYDGNGLVPASLPFVLENSGTVRYINADVNTSRPADIRRKYYQSENVVNMRRRLLGGRIQCADRPDFSDAQTVFTVESTDFNDRIPVMVVPPCRYWRYLSADGSYGSIAELAFYDGDSIPIPGKPVSNSNDNVAMLRAFDGDMLSNFETDQPDGNWIGIDAGKKTSVRYVRLVPRSDDNDVCPGDEYELFFWNSQEWKSLGGMTATDNCLHYDSIPEGALLWLRDYTRGSDERPFIIAADGSVEWR